VFKNLDDIDCTQWLGLLSFIQIKRKVVHKGKTTEETVYFISSLSANIPAEEFLFGIRSHWAIESMHYVKDVVFGEDASKVKKGFAPENMSLVRNFVLNLFRKHGINEIKATTERCANNVVFMKELMGF
jgi:predicted transposase YbfD/YdcC